MRQKAGTIKHDDVPKNAHIWASGFGIQFCFISNEGYGGELYSKIKRSEYRHEELEIQGKSQGSIRQKAGTIKRGAVHKNAHILGIGFPNSIFSVLNESYGRKLNAEMK